MKVTRTNRRPEFMVRKTDYHQWLVRKLCWYEAQAQNEGHTFRPDMGTAHKNLEVLSIFNVK